MLRNKNEMSNWFNLLLSLLLVYLCVLCVTQIGTSYSLVGGGRSSIETRIEHNYRFYNNSIISLLGTINISFLTLFFLGRFINKTTSALQLKHILGILPFTFAFLFTSFYNYNKPLFSFHFNYFIALGLNASILILLIYLTAKRSSPPLDDILDQP